MTGGLQKRGLCGKIRARLRRKRHLIPRHPMPPDRRCVQRMLPSSAAASCLPPSPRRSRALAHTRRSRRRAAPFAASSRRKIRTRRWSAPACRSRRRGALRVADERGAYILRDLPAGSYAVTATANGRQPVRRDVTVASGEVATLDIAMPRGPLLLSSVDRLRHAHADRGEQRRVDGERADPRQSRRARRASRRTCCARFPASSCRARAASWAARRRSSRFAASTKGAPRCSSTAFRSTMRGASGSTGGACRRGCSITSRSSRAARRTSTATARWAASSRSSRALPPMARSNARRRRQPRHAPRLRRPRAFPIAGALTANFNGDYQDGGGYTLLDAGEARTRRRARRRSSSATAISGSTTRRRATVSAFVTGHLFADNRNIGHAARDQSRYQRNVQLGADYAGLGGGSLAVRAWDGVQDEHQRSSTVRANSATCDDPSADPRQCEDSSVVARIPSHDWGASAMWTRAGRAASRVDQLRRRLPAHERRLRRSGLQHDAAPARTAAPSRARSSPAAIRR